MQKWIENHLNKLHDLQLNSRVTDREGNELGLDNGFEWYLNQVAEVKKRGGKLIFIGNGGSAGIASHLAIDHSKNGGIPAVTFTDASALTCLSNDFGYEYVFSKQIEYYAAKQDMLIAISSSGKSKNILNAVDAARTLGCSIFTLSGFDAANPLSKKGDINIFTDSDEYGYVEVSHMALGHTVLDYYMEHHLPKHDNNEPAKLTAVE